MAYNTTRAQKKKKITSQRDVDREVSAKSGENFLDLDSIEGHDGS